MTQTRNSDGRLTIRQRMGETDRPFLTREASWKGMSGQLLQVVQPTSLEYDYQGKSSMLALQDFSRGDGETLIAGGPRSTLKDLRNKLTFVPKGAKLEGWTTYKQRISTALVVNLEPEAIEQDYLDFQNVDPSLHFQNETLHATLLKIQAILENNDLDDPIYAELLGLVLIHELSHASLGKILAGRAKGGLSPRQLKLIKEYVDQRITSDISISELADLVGLSRFHFIRSFKEATGQSPYQFILAERVDRAKQQLMAGNHSIEEVAAAIGFSSALQLSRAFRRFTGQTATTFRRSLSK